MDATKGYSAYQLLGPVTQNESMILERLNIPKKVYQNKNTYYSENKKTIWIGNLVDEQPEGHGIFIISGPKKIIIVGEAKEGFKHGKGKVYFEDGSFFQASFRKDEWDGSTEYFSSDNKKILSAKFLTENNVEITYTSTGESYVGEHFYLTKHGRGKSFRDDSKTMESIQYNGIWNYDQFVQGYGKTNYYTGELSDNNYNGNGTLFYDKDCTRKKYAGTFTYGKLNGEGVEFYDNPLNDIKYQGNFVDGIYDGEGAFTELTPVKRTYRGKFRKGILNMIVEVLDEQDRLFQKVMYKDGEVIEVIEEYFYDIVLPSIKEVTEDELKSGCIETQVLEKVVCNNQLSSVKYFKKRKDEVPFLIMQYDPKLFQIKYEGILSQSSGSLVYSGDMTHVLFSGKGTLRYAMKNEPRKYHGEFYKGLFHGTGNLYSSSNQILYCGEFRQNKFDGKGTLMIHSIYLIGNNDLNPKQLASGKYEADRYDVEVDGVFIEGKFQGGVWRYSGTSEAVMDRVLSIKVSKKSDHLLGKMYEKKVLVFEGVFENYTFNGEGTLYYKNGSTIKYHGQFKDGIYHGFGELHDSTGKIVYSGEFNEGSYHGKGKLFQGLPENSVFEGEFIEGKIRGKGKMLDPIDNSLRSEGLYEDGKLIEGFIKIFDNYTKVLRYEGMIKRGKYDGEGILYTPKGDIQMKGIFKDGVLIEGLQRQFFNSSDIVEREGNVVNGKYEGKVKEYYFDGKLQYEGNYQNGERNGEGIIYHKNGKPKQVGIFKDNVFYEGEALYYHDDNLTVKFEGRVKTMYYNGYGKKYHENGFLEYEGTFKNGLFDGDGVYYYSEEADKIKFKGRFGEGVPKGDGEFFDLKGRLIYKGSMVNWKKEGKGIFYSPSGEVLLEGIFDDDDIFKGFGKLYWPGFGTLKYEGEFDNGYQEGKGTSYYTNGNIEYQGSFKTNHPDGVGVLFDENEEGLKIYEGSVQRGRYHGTGILYLKDETYEGEFRQGKKYGKGILRYNNPQYGTKFEGTFYLDEMDEGHASLRDSEGNLIYEGSIKKNLYDGEGTKYYKNGKVEYEGAWKEGLYDGYGKKYLEDGNLEYDGEFVRGHYHGHGKLYRKNQTLQYEGQFYKGNIQGEGIMYDEKEQIIYEGSIKDGQFHGKGKLYFKNSNKVKYEGEFKGGMFSGFGVKHSKKGYKKYEGNFMSSKFDGEGTLYHPDGSTKKYSGEFQMKKYNGKGTLYNQAGNTIYDGMFSQGRYHGTGVLFSTDNPGVVYYEGNFNNGEIQGEGEIRYPNGNIQYKGEFKAGGTYHGRGILYTEDGKIKCQGAFVNGNHQA